MPSRRAVTILSLWSVFQHFRAPRPDDLSSFQLWLPFGEMRRCWGSRAGGTDHWPTEARRGVQPLSCCCLCRDLRLIEVTETICKRLLDYSLHKERTGSNRFAKVGFVLVLHPHWGQAWRCLSGLLVWVWFGDHAWRASLLGLFPFFIDHGVHFSPSEWPGFSVAHSSWPGPAHQGPVSASDWNAGWQSPWRPDHLLSESSGSTDLWALEMSEDMAGWGWGYYLIPLGPLGTHLDRCQGACVTFSALTVCVNGSVAEQGVSYNKAHSSLFLRLQCLAHGKRLASHISPPTYPSSEVGYWETPGKPRDIVLSNRSIKFFKFVWILYSTQ